MNKILFPAILCIIAVGIFLTYTKDQYATVQGLRDVNAKYTEAIANSEALISKKDQVINAYNNISEEDRTRLTQILPDRSDNVRLVVDIRSVIERRGGLLKAVTAGETKVGTTSLIRENTAAGIVSDGSTPEEQSDTLPTVIKFQFTATYDSFLAILRDIESDLRITEITKIAFTPGDKAQYDFEVEVKAFSLKQQ